MNTPTLILPGYGNSDENHWQSLWESKHSSAKRVHQRSWNKPVCNDWVEALENAVKKTGDETKLVAHSLGCLLLARWAAQTNLNIAGALLVATPDPDGDNFPQQALGFSPVDLAQFNFPSTVIASSNDPYSDITFSRHCAKRWGSKFIEIGSFGHINSDSGLNNWPFGLNELISL